MAENEMFNDFLSRLAGQVARNFESASITPLRSLDEMGGADMNNAVYVVYAPSGAPITAGAVLEGTSEEEQGAVRERLAALSSAGVVDGFRSVSFQSPELARAVLRIVGGLFGGSMIVAPDVPRRRRARSSVAAAPVDPNAPKRRPGRPRKTPPPTDLPPTA